MLGSHTFAEKAKLCAQKAEEAEAKAYGFQDAMRAKLAKEGRSDYFDFEMDRHHGFKTAVADNRWYIVQSTMYAQLALLEDLGRSVVVPLPSQGRRSS